MTAHGPEASSSSTKAPPPAYSSQAQTQSSQPEQNLEVHSVRAGNSQLEVVALPFEPNSSLCFQVEKAEFYVDRLDLSLFRPSVTAAQRAGEAVAPTEQGNGYFGNNANGASASKGHIGSDTASIAESSVFTHGGGGGPPSTPSSVNYPGDSTTALLLPSGASVNGRTPAAAPAPRARLNGSAGAPLPLALAFLPPSYAKPQSSQAFVPLSALLPFPSSGTANETQQQSQAATHLTPGSGDGEDAWDWSMQLARLEYGQGSANAESSSSDDISGRKVRISHVIRKRQGGLVFEVVEKDEDGTSGRCRTAKFTKGLFKDKLSVPAGPAASSGSGEEGGTSADHVDWAWKGNIHSIFTLKALHKNGSKTVLATLFFGESRFNFRTLSPTPYNDTDTENSLARLNRPTRQAQARNRLDMQRPTPRHRDRLPDHQDPQGYLRQIIHQQRHA